MTEDDRKPVPEGGDAPAETAARPSESFGAGTPDPALQEKIAEVLTTVYDPEIPVDIYAMGMIYEIRADTAGSAYVKMTLTSPACPVAGSLPGEVERKVQGVDGVSEVRVDLVWDPPWTMDMISEEARLRLNI